MSIKLSLIKNTSFNLGGYLYLLVASFFSVSILLNNLGQDVFGVYIFLTSFVPLAAVFEFGISNAVIRKLSLPNLHVEERNKTWQTSFALFIFLAFLLSAIITSLLLYLAKTMPIFSIIDSNTLNWSVFFIAIIVFVNHVDNHFLNLTQSQQRFDIFNSKTLLVGTANTLISAGISIRYPNIALLYGAQLVFHLLTLKYMIYHSRKTFSGKNFWPLYDHKTGKELLSFGLRNFVGTLAGQLENQISNFILGAMVSARAITSFSIPQSIVAKGAGVVSQFAQVFFPLSASLLTKDRILKLKLMVLGLESLILTGGLFVILLTFLVGEQFLSWWLKDPVVVASAYPVLKILSFYFVLVSLTPIPTALVQGLNKPQIPSFFAVLTVALEIVLALILVPKYQTLGVAYAFLGSVVFTVPLFLIVCWRQLQGEIRRILSPDEIPPQTKPVSAI